MKNITNYYFLSNALLFKIDNGNKSLKKKRNFEQQRIIFIKEHFKQWLLECQNFLQHRKFLIPFPLNIPHNYFI